jgi:glycosyltransferase involved in cell wall biosynthesis
VLPTYNGAAFIEAALVSVFRQSLLPQEIIVVDDCSTDGTRDIVARVARKAPMPLRLIELPRNSGGPTRPLNLGIATASGEFIAVLDQDDVFMPTKLEEQVACLVSHPDLVFAFSVCGRHDQPDAAVAAPEVLHALRTGGTPAKDFRRLGGPETLRLLLTHGNFVTGYPGLLFRRKDWQHKGGLDERLAIASDYEFLCWLCLQGNAGFLDRIHYLRRNHAANLCHRWKDTRIEAERVRARYLARLPGVLADARLSATLRERVFELAFLLRERGHYLDALRHYCISLRAWGWEARTLMAMAKLLPHWLLRRKAAGLGAALGGR